MKLIQLAAPFLLFAAGCSAGTERDKVPEAQTVQEEVDFGTAEQPTSDEDSPTTERASRYD